MKKFTTTASFISSHVKPSGYALDEIIETEGYTAKGDRGAARWKALGTVGTASVNPLTNNSPNLSDASGNEFVLVGEGVIDLNVLGGTTAAYVNIATAAGLTYSQGLTSDVSNDIKNIDTVANAIADTSLVVGDAVMIKERANGIFDVISGTGTANGFGIIAHSTLPISLKIVKTTPVLAKSYGLKIDGVTDDTAACQALIESVTSGGDVLFESGVMIIDSGAFIGVDINGFSNISLKGEEGFVIRTPLGGSEGRPFVMRNGDGLLVENITFDNLNTAGSINGLDVQNVDNTTIRGNTFKGQTFYGLGVFQDTIALLDGTCDNLLVEGNTFSDINTIGAEIFPKVLSTEQVIRNNVFIRCGTIANGTAFKCAQGYERSDVHDNLIIDCGKLGVTSFATSIGMWGVCNFHDNTFINCPRTSIAITVQTHSLFSQETYNTLSVVNNTIFDNSSAPVKSDSAITLSVADATKYNANSGTILFKDNVIKGQYRAIECRPIQDIARVSFNDNEVINTINIGFYTDTANGGAMVSPSITNNLFTSDDPLKTLEDVRLDSIKGSYINGNLFVRSGDYAVRYFNATSGKHLISGNDFVDGQVVAGPTRAPIYSNDTSATVYTIQDNAIVGGNWTSLLLATNATPTFRMDGNTVDRLATDSTPTTTTSNLLGNLTLSADAPVNGYITVLDSNGNSVKVATIA